MIARSALIVLRVVMIAWFWFAAGSLVGCQNTTLAAGSSTSPTGGIALEMYTRGANHEAVYYRIHPDGRLGFAGGFPAHDRVPQWEGDMRAEEIDRLRTLLERDGWWRGEITASGQPTTRRWEIQVVRPENGHRYVLIGEDARLDRLRSFLELVASRRLEPFLETLPKAGDPTGRP